MNRKDVAYVINTTPKYFYLLRLHLLLLQRYAPQLAWPIYLATEVPDHPEIQMLQMQFSGLRIIPLTQEQEGFLESRAAAAAALPDSIQYILPIQEDFLLEAHPLAHVLEDALRVLDEFQSIDSLRLMPCPGPKGTERFADTEWILLDHEKDEYVFTYQATLWRRESYQTYMTSLLRWIESHYPQPLAKLDKVAIQIKQNIGENAVGQSILKRETQLHLAWRREGSWPNAVYLAPWPYRPTAVVQGMLQPWARDLATREGCPLNSLTS